MKRDAKRTVVYEFSEDEVLAALNQTYQLDKDLKYDPRLLIAAKRAAPSYWIQPLFIDNNNTHGFNGLRVSVSWEDQ